MSRSHPTDLAIVRWVRGFETAEYLDEELLELVLGHADQAVLRCRRCRPQEWVIQQVLHIVQPFAALYTLAHHTVTCVCITDSPVGASKQHAFAHVEEQAQVIPW